MTRISFTVPAVPVAQPRARATQRGGFVSMYEAPAKHAIHSFKATVKMAAAESFQRAPFDEPLWMSLAFIFPRPGNMIWKRRPMPRVPKAGKNQDVDNLAKSVLDALNKLAYTDDGLVSYLEISKWTAAGDEQPRVEVIIGTLTSDIEYSFAMARPKPEKMKLEILPPQLKATTDEHDNRNHA